MNDSEAKREWLRAVLGVVLSDDTKSDPFDFAGFAGIEDAPPPEDKLASDLTVPQLKKAINSNLEKIEKLQPHWSDVDPSNFNIFRGRVDKDDGEGLADLLDSTSNMLGRLVAERDAGPALEQYEKHLSSQQLEELAIKSRRAFGGRTAKAERCLIAGQMVEEKMRSEIVAKLPETEPDRSKALDELAKSIGDPEALIDQARMRAVITLRFGIEFAVEDPLMVGHKKGLGRLYEVLALVPPKHLASLEQLESETRTGEKGARLSFSDDEGNPGDYSRESKTIRISVPLEHHKEIERANSAGEPATVQWFKQVSLHEVGHAVDDANGYMKQHRADGQHGAWLESERNKALMHYASGLQKKIGSETISIGDNRNIWKPIQFIAFSFLHRSIQPQDINIDNQDIRQVAADISALVAGLKVGAKFWNQGLGAAQKIAALATDDDRVHFEAYKGQWWSFDVKQRANAVSDYQWRSPGEWFAEPYALHLQGKLDKNHPVAKFCDGNG